MQGDMSKQSVTRIFGPEELHKLAMETLPAIVPDGEKNALVLAATQSGLKIALHYEKQFKTATWQLEAAYLHEWDGNKAVGFNSVLWF